MYMLYIATACTFAKVEFNQGQSIDKYLKVADSLYVTFFALNCVIIIFACISLGMMLNQVLRLLRKIRAD